MLFLFLLLITVADIGKPNTLYIKFIIFIINKKATFSPEIITEIIFIMYY